MAEAGARSFGLFTDGFFLYLPIHAEWRIGEHIVKRTVFVFIFEQRVTIFDGVWTTALNQQVCFAECKRIEHKFLTKQRHANIWVEFCQSLLCYKQHTARASCGVIDGP